MKNFRKIFVVALFFAVIGIVSILNVPQAKAAATTSSITVLSPNGGEQYPIGSTQTIKWLSNASSTDKVNVYLYNESSVIPAVPTLIGLLTPNDGSENWTVPSSFIPGDKYRIEIKKADNDLIKDSSDLPFSIVATSTLSKPDLIVKSITENTASNSISIVIKNIGAAGADITNSIVRVIYGSNYYNKIENCNPDNIACLTVNRKRVDEYNAGINAGFLYKKILAPKEEYSILFNKPNYLLQDINFKPGKIYLIKAYVDFNNGVAEINERNNSLSKTIKVRNVLGVKLRNKF